MRQRVCLIGDHHQLPPVVKNLALQKYGQTRSTACRCTHTRALTHPWPRKPPRGSPRGAEELRLLRAPTLRSSACLRRYCRLDQTLFTRFVRLGVPHVLLDMQGRARPEIAAL